MSEHDVDHEPAEGTAAEPSTPDGDVSPCYQAYIEEREFQPDTCTIYAAVNRASVAETWIRAHGDAFVSREDAR